MYLYTCNVITEIDLEPDDLSRAANDLDIADLLGAPDETELGRYQ